MPSAVDDLLNLPPYGLPAEAKAAALLAAARESLACHMANCPPYARWRQRQGFDPEALLEKVTDVPFLPVGIFKRMFLASVPEKQIVRVLASSGTSGQSPSRIPLDQVTRNRQMKALTAILSHRLGAQRRPFLVLDAPSDRSAGDDRELSARVAGMRGYLMAATEQEYALTRDGGRLVLDRDRVRGVIAHWTSSGKPFCLLGYTHLLYESVVRPLFDERRRIELPPSAFVVHFGGWKKLAQRTVTKAVLNERASAVFGLPPCAIVDIYGFTEQLGVIYPDDPQGVKRAPTYSEVLVRDPRSLAVVPDGEVGLLEFVCPLPHSYPGVAVLLDDMGRIVSREGGDTAFEIVGRAEKAEARGCGDTLPG